MTDVVEGKGKQAAGEKEARKRTWRRVPQDRTLQRKAWTLKTLGGKTVWDWLQLLGVLAIPVVIAVGGWMFNAQQNERQKEFEEQRANNERKIEEQRAQDAALQAYLDQMSQLMLEGGLHSSEAGSEVRSLARARTQTVLARLDGRRKGSVVQFLYEASLIDKEHPVVSLSAVGLPDDADLDNLNVGLRGADLRGLNLEGADLGGADLRGANLRGALMNGADLSEADLRYAYLSWADLSGSEVSDADLRYAVLRYADLRYADLGRIDLSGALMNGAVLNDADLREAYLIDADLREANLSFTNLSGALLNGADLSEANLSGAKGVTDEQLEEQAKILEGATMPDGSIHD